MCNMKHLAIQIDAFWVWIWTGVCQLVTTALVSNSLWNNIKHFENGFARGCNTCSNSAFYKIILGRSIVINKLNLEETVLHYFLHVFLKSCVVDYFQYIVPGFQLAQTNKLLTLILQMSYKVKGFVPAGSLSLWLWGALDRVLFFCFSLYHMDLIKSALLKLFNKKQYVFLLKCVCVWDQEKPDQQAQS